MSYTYGHSYYFAFAEVEYNDFTNKFECTLTASTHDINHIIIIDSISTLPIEKIQSETTNYLKLESFLNEHFQIRGSSFNSQFNLQGIDVLLNGNVNFYLESNEINLPSGIDIKYDLLFDHFEEQQNKVNFIYKNTSVVLEFIGESSFKSIQLETIKQNE